MGVFARLADQYALEMLKPGLETRVADAIMSCVQTEDASDYAVRMAAYVTTAYSIADGPTAGTITSIPGFVHAYAQRASFIAQNASKDCNCLFTVRCLTKSPVSVQRMLADPLLV